MSDFDVEKTEKGATVTLGLSWKWWAVALVGVAVVAVLVFV